MKYLMALLIIVVLSGCGVDEPHAEAYQAVAETCQKQGKVMFVEKYTNRTIVRCIDP